ncbi:MAG: hypothetical protein ACP5HM_02220 [Anaerolineae bacterium]
MKTSSSCTPSVRAPYPTTEVRWFFEGTVPPQVEAWFQALNSDAAGGGRRTDYYLRLPNEETLGVKWREDRIEIKRRVGDVEVVSFAPQITGAVGRWRKWSFALSESEATGALQTSKDWVAIAKVRRLYTYAVDDKGIPRLASGFALPRGCELELTRIQALGQRWWTLGFEAFGDETSQPEALRQTVAHTLQGTESFILPLTASADYPRWLSVCMSSRR